MASTYVNPYGAPPRRRVVPLWWYAFALAMISTAAVAVTMLISAASAPAPQRISVVSTPAPVVTPLTPLVPRH